MRIIETRKYWYILSVLLVGGSLLGFAKFGLKQGIDFTGGTEMTLRFEQARPSSEEMEKIATSFQIDAVVYQPVGDHDVRLRFKTIEESVHQDLLKKIRETDPKASELQYNAIGPAVGEELRQKSVQALLIIFLAILLFIAYAFRKVSAPVASWKYGVIVLVTAFHDVAVPIGVFVLLGKFYHVEIGTPFIAAILTIMGYSINDTIVVMDRIRENLLKMKGSFEEIVEVSLKQTILRSFNTSMTTTLALLAVYFFGGESIKHFALALIIGILTGTYSSIFIASPLLVTWSRWQSRKNKTQNNK